MANPLDYINTTSATQALDKISSAASGLSSTFQQGIGSVQAGVQNLSANLSKAGVSISNAINGGIKTVTDKFQSEFANLPKPPAVPNKTPQQLMAAKKDTADHVFPSDIGDYFILFSFYEYVRPVATVKATKKKTSSIALPLPQNLGESFLMQYEQIDMGQIAATVANAVGGMKVKDLVTTAEGVKELAKAAGPSAVQAGVGLLAGSGIAQDAANALQQVGGFAPNPHIGLLFKGVNIRAPHTFTYRLSPKTPAESIKIREIVRQLKVRMHPSMGTGQLNFNYPDLCDITIKRPPGEDDELYKFKACFLESMTVNYSPNGVPTFFAGTRHPTDIEITMTFKEAAIFTREDFQDVKSGTTSVPTKTGS